MGAELERRGGGDAGRWVGEARSPLRQAGQFQPMGEPGAQILRKVSPSQRGAGEVHPLGAGCSTLKNPYLPRESKWSKGNVGGPEVDVSDKSQAVRGGNPGGGGDAGGVTRRLV